MKLNKLTPEEARVIVHKGTERPYTGELYEDESTVLYVNRTVEQLKDTDEINGIIDRELREL